MFGSADDASWDSLTSFGERVFDGVSGDAHARVDGSLHLVEVVAEHYDASTGDDVRKAINAALHTARSELARHLANATDLDLPEPLRELLETTIAAEELAPEPPFEYAAERGGVIAHVNGDSWLLTRLTLPDAQSLPAVPEVVNAALAAAETGRELPPVDALFHSRWASIVGGLQDVEHQLDAILAELGEQD